MRLPNIEALSTKQVLTLLIVLCALFAAIPYIIYGLIYAGELSFQEWFVSLSLNFSTELLGAFVAYALFARIIGKRLENEARLETLISEMRSRDIAVAERAVRELNSLGHLSNGKLQNKDFSGANLSSVKLNNADLQGASFMQAILADTDFRNANLKGADLLLADLTWTKFEGTQFDEKTRLPDGRFWSAATDLNRYTGQANRFQRMTALLKRTPHTIPEHAIQNWLAFLIFIMIYWGYKVLNAAAKVYTNPHLK